MLLKSKGITTCFAELVDTSFGEVDFYQLDLTQPALGLPQAVHEDLRLSVTHIIHNAWQVISTYISPVLYHTSEACAI